MKDKIVEHYSNLFEEFGDDPRSTQYPNRESQIQRFVELSSNVANGDSVGDIGSGTSEMLKYLDEKMGFKGEYFGLDITPNLIEFAQEKYKNREQTSFLCGDAMDATNYKQMDWYLCSGAFNNRFDEELPATNSEFLYETISLMYEHSNKGIAFNALSTFVDYMEEHLFYIDPLEVFKYCRTKLSPFVTLKHDYVLGTCKFPYEFTIFVHKN